MAKASKSVYAIWKNFKQVRQEKKLSAFECALYHELVMICNSNMWQDKFKIGNSELTEALSISESSLRRSRKKLIAVGLILYESSQTKGDVGTYTLLILGSSTDTQNDISGVTQAPDKKNRVSHRHPKTDLGSSTDTQNDISGVTQTPEAPGNPLPVSDTEGVILNNTYNNTINNTLYPENEFSGTPEKEKKVRQKKGQKPPANPAYALIIEHWLKVVHPGWTFNNIHGIKVKSIISQLERRLLNDGLPAAPENIVASFKLICENLPDWYKDKDLPIIDSKLNEITEYIKNKQNGQQQQFTTRAAAAYNDAAAKYGRRAQRKAE